MSYYSDGVVKIRRQSLSRINTGSDYTFIIGYQPLVTTTAS